MMNLYVIYYLLKIKKKMDIDVKFVLKNVSNVLLILPLLKDLNTLQLL